MGRGCVRGREQAETHVSSSPVAKKEFVTVVSTRYSCQKGQGASADKLHVRAAKSLPLERNTANKMRAHLMVLP